MARPYAPMRGRMFGRHYHIDQTLVRYPCAGSRPTKLAAGMQFTAARKGGKSGDLSEDALHLAVRGTLDVLAMGNRMTRHRYRYFDRKAVTTVTYVRKAVS